MTAKLNGAAKNHEKSFDKGDTEAFLLTAQNGTMAQKDIDVEKMPAEASTREHWSRKTEYILSMVGFCVGLGNIWRFPYVCIRNGGGAFLIPFLICLTLCAMPLFFMEVSLGQFLGKSAMNVWSICPLFKGMGISMNIISLLFAWYYTMILAWTLIFIVNSCRETLPWTLCDQPWNTPNCMPPGGFKPNVTNTTLANTTNEAVNSTTWVSSTEEFWKNNVLEMSDGLHNFDGIPWHTAVALICTSIIIFCCLVKGVHSVGKVVYVTATLPYLLLTILIIKGATLPGAIDGVIFYVKPDFDKLITLQTWVEATIQVFYSLGPAYGGLITMASYNKFNNNCLRDAVVLSFVCEGSSIFGGFAIFTVLGHMAHTLNVDVSNFTKTGPGLAFVVYPEAISYLPIPQLWGVLFFIMLLTLGLDSQFTVIETMLTSIADRWPRIISRWRVAVTGLFLVFLTFISLPFASRAGMYLFQLADWYSAAFTIIVDAILECVIVAWVYGADRFFRDIELMLGRQPPRIFCILWRFITPFMLTVVLGCTLATYKPPVYGDYTYSAAGVAIGWIIACISFVPIPVVAVVMLLKEKGTLKERLISTCTPALDWLPNDPDLQEHYAMKRSNKPVCVVDLSCLKVSDC